MSPTDKPDGSTHSGSPAPEDVRAELERILASRSFESAGRSSEFLRFVVEQHLAGAADRLKGYTIAIEVFRRPPEFDAQSDPLVRVEAGRLRRRLLEYYAAEGHSDPLRIELPRGGYAPQFRRATPLESTGTLTPAAPPRGRRWRRRVRAFAGSLLILLLAALVVMQYRNREPTEEAAASADALALPKGPKILVLPFENLSGDSKIDYVADGVTEEIMLRLSDFHLFVIASQTTWSYRGADRAPAAIGEELGARYVLTGTVRNTSDRVRISARLVHAASGAQLWTAAYDEDLSAATLVDIQEKIAREVVETVAVPYGPIYEQELARATRKPAAHLDTYDCMLKYYAYRRTIDPALHGETLGCFQSAVAREPNFADAWAGLAMLYLDEYAYGYTPQSSAASALDRAREAARKALDIDGDNYLANLALARVRFFGGDLEGFARSADRVLNLSHNNAEVLTMLGTLFEISGSTARAQPLIDKVLALSPHPPSLYRVAESIADLRAGRADDALEAALKIDAPNWFIAPLLVAVSAGLAGRTDVAQRAAARLLELYPKFPERFHAEVAKWQVDPALGEPMLRGLLAAGLPLDAPSAD
jgi:TolB-like protein